ncbi:hypothetical protein NM80_2075 [Neisseria meningitidis NM80]|nr:hypothetical protein NM27_2163 [Neisseria meningitidis NM27]EOC75838.1 hypothetical protein NM80_2075 [Neisseria meningitidis NM80]
MGLSWTTKINSILLIVLKWNKNFYLTVVKTPFALL